MIAEATKNKRRVSMLIRGKPRAWLIFDRRGTRTATVVPGAAISFSHEDRSNTSDSDGAMVLVLFLLLVGWLLFP